VPHKEEGRISKNKGIRKERGSVGKGGKDTRIKERLRNVDLKKKRMF
jgi:hypothetical protein